MAVYANWRRKRMVLRFILPLFFSGIILLSACSNNPNTSENTALSGADLYVKSCAVCHGNDGKKGLSGASDLSTSTLDYTSLVDVITNGRKIMPPFKTTLKAHEIEAIAKHVESLKQSE